uniref:Complex 1 LYR protein domain-containing protein n=1 Tax=Neolamprologus brichardi TaxID=32507 RepID=A0A3Q4MGU0_NEOBR
MAAAARSQVMSLYRTMLRESAKFPSYNYRLTLDKQTWTGSVPSTVCCSDQPQSEAASSQSFAIKDAGSCRSYSPQVFDPNSHLIIR